ncbi:MAG: tetratricopeptide repeat protein [Candidatus Eisenbacteria bacterium]|uniref:Tetratricopeptide repeat protein n=1 Tax=Eiseniibacteriota bacterium TaxID=2212470 RepID=A0A538TIC7_UNCEI|nr:MAG: tetratricopeptide repeat protein [Candidatus Eisenbacteria bacterium]
MGRQGRERSAARGRHLPLPPVGQGSRRPRGPGVGPTGHDLHHRSARRSARGPGGTERGAAQMIRRPLATSLALAAVLSAAGTTVATCPATWAASKAAREAPPAPHTTEVGDAFEQTRQLADEQRLAALEQASQSVDQVLRGDVDPDQRAAARFLAGKIQYELGNYRKAAETLGEAVKDGKSRFADDAAFAAIEALEAQGRDAEAARAWIQWEKRFPASPLMPAARLAQIWNAMRRGEVAAAQKLIPGLTAAYPWMEKDQRLVLAKAMVAYSTGKVDDALSLLGAKPMGPSALYLKAMCLESKGSLLKAAAAFQEVGERYTDSPLRDHALLAKANAFLEARDYRSAAEEFARVGAKVSDPAVKAEAELRAAGAVFLSGGTDSSLGMLRGVTERHAGSDVAARAQFLVGEALVAQGKPAEAIVEFNRVLSQYFQHKVAASAQYRVARSLDAMGRRSDATGSYQAVVAGYPLEPEAPAAAYLAGVGLMDQNKPLAAAPYFQLVLDRYAAKKDQGGHVVFARPEHQELVEAALCLLQLCYHRAGDLGQLSGAPHLLLQQMPASHSAWRAYALLIDADAAAAQGRYPEAQKTLEELTRDFPDHPVGASAIKLLAWTQARQGNDSLAIATEERLLARYGASGDDEVVSSAFLDIAHERFNQKRYKEAAGAYEDFLKRFPGHPRRTLALYQAGLCYLRLERAGDAVDRWETLMRDTTSSPLAERAGRALQRSQALLRGPAGALRGQPRGFAREPSSRSVRVQRRARRRGAERVLDRDREVCGDSRRQGGDPRHRARALSTEPEQHRHADARDPGRAVSDQRVRRRRPLPDRQALVPGEALDRRRRAVPPRGEPVPRLLGGRPRTVPDGRCLRAGPRS